MTASTSQQPGWLDRLLATGQRPGDDPDLRVRKRTAIITVIALILAGSSYAFVGLASNRPIVAVFSVLQCVGQGLGVVYLARTGKLGPVVVNMMILGLLVIASGVATLGGMVGGSGNLVWGTLTPIAAVLFFGRRAALPAFAGFALVVIVAALFDEQFRAMASFIPTDLAIPLYVINLLAPTAIGLALVVFIDGERVRAKAQSESLLLNVLPRAIVDRLNSGERVIADHCPDVTVLFSDVVDFTPFSERQPAQHVVEVLNRLFSAFDELTDRYRLEKIKTIGDAYMVVAGVPAERPDHAEVMLEMALAMHAAADVQPEVEGHRLQLRTGIATGPVVAGVIGRQKFSYDLWGDTVNTASRMESSGIPGCIQVTPKTWERVRDRYPWEVRENVEVKGKGAMRTYLLDPGKVGS